MLADFNAGSEKSAALMSVLMASSERIREQETPMANVAKSISEATVVLRIKHSLVTNIWYPFPVTEAAGCRPTGLAPILDANPELKVARDMATT
jgi:hypothetical protein